MSDDPFDALETVYDCLKRMQTTLLGMKKIREYVGKGLGREMLDSLIEEAETQLAEITRKAQLRDLEVREQGSVRGWLLELSAQVLRSHWLSGRHCRLGRVPAGQVRPA